MEVSYSRKETDWAAPSHDQITPKSNVGCAHVRSDSSWSRVSSRSEVLGSLVCSYLSGDRIHPEPHRLTPTKP